MSMLFQKLIAFFIICNITNYFIFVIVRSFSAYFIVNVKNNLMFTIKIDLNCLAHTLTMFAPCVSANSKLQIYLLFAV